MVVIRIFLRAADRLLDLVGRDVAELCVVIAAERRAIVRKAQIERVPADVGPGCGIVGRDAFSISVREHGDRVAAIHAGGLDALKRPGGRTIGALLRLADEVVNETARHLRPHERHQWMQRAIGVPERIGAERLLALFELMDLLVEADISAVPVAEQRRHKQRMVEGTRHDRSLRVRAAGDADRV